MISGKMFGVFGDSSSAKDILEEKLKSTGLIMLVVLVFQGLFSFLRVYFKGIVNPGEGVGAVGSSSIGEPSTQMTLNIFHYSLKFLQLLHKLLNFYPDKN